MDNPAALKIISKEEAIKSVWAQMKQLSISPAKLSSSPPGPLSAHHQQQATVVN